MAWKIEIGVKMKIYSWNVNGIRSVLKKGFEDWFTATDPDVLCLQEVRAEKSQVSEIASREGYYTYWNACKRKKGYSGVAVFSKIEPDAVMPSVFCLRWQTSICL